MEALVLFLIWTSASAAAGAPDAEPELLLVHTGSVLGSLRDLFESGSGSDLTLRVQTSDLDQVEILPVHALVLTIHSPVFGHMIQSRKSPVLELTESPEAVAVFGKFIRYLYTGVLLLHQREALSLHRLSCKFNVSSLRQGLEEHMAQVLDSDWPGALVTSWLEYAVQTGQPWLHERCISTLALNLYALLQSGGFARLSTDLLLDLLSRSDLVLYSELDLFHAVQTWIQTNDPDGLTAENALRNIRYAMIPPQDLFQIQALSPVLQRYQDSVRDLLLWSFQFHSGSPRSTGGRYLDLNCSLFIPRVYLGPDWGQAWTITDARQDQHSLSLQTQLGPSGSDRFRRVQWNVRYSPMWSTSRPTPSWSPAHISVTPAAAAPELSGILFHKSLLLVGPGNCSLRLCHFHLSSSENPDCLKTQDRDQIQVHLVIRPVYHGLN
ncbi:unnamed protein product [Knipowitschia caucasica]|uniref:BTB domain-containing protein n=1 Tax=Knipowitschia caucasica TaxID=637954 RepID=A0AAV2LC03_KNICA